MKQPFFAVLGGMGTLATESYVRLVDQASDAHTDQEFLDYVVFNDASVPDRTEFILGRGKDNPLVALADDTRKASAMGASFITIPCNTAHYFFDELQSLTDVPILNMPQETVDEIVRSYPPTAHPRVGFMGTRGSTSCDIYSVPLRQAGYEFVAPDDVLQDEISELIYRDVKETGVFDEARYMHPIDTLLARDHCDVIVLGCTELSVLNEAFPKPHLPIVDAQVVLAKRTVQLARQLRDQP